MQKAKNRLNIVLLDACRNNPFLKGGSGLGESKDAKGIYIAYSTSPGKVALDGKQNNSPFALTIKEYIDKPLPIEQMFKKVRSYVYNNTNETQLPYTNSGLLGDFYFTLPTQRYNKEVDEIELLKAKLAKFEKQKNNSCIKETSLFSNTQKDKGSYIEPAMVKISSGSFMMGSEDGEADEKPVHRVNIGYDFYMGKYEVTVGEFEKFIDDTKHKTDAQKYGGCYIYNNQQF